MSDRSALSKNGSIQETGDVSIRPLGAFEHFFWLIDQDHPVHFALTAEIAGKTVPADWRDALHRVQLRHPLLSVRIEGTPPSVPHFRRAGAAEIPLRIVQGDPATDWEAVVAEELATPFDPGQAPLIRAALIPGRDRAALTLVSHHSIADGYSLAYLIRDILQSLAGIDLEPLPLQQSQEELLALNYGPMLDSVAANRQWNPIGSQPMSFRPRDNAKPKVRGLRLPADFTSILKNRARQEGTTVHGVLCAALVIAGRKVSLSWRDRPVRILSPISTRKMLGAGESCGIFLAGADDTFIPEISEFWELARLARSGVNNAQAYDSVAAGYSGLQRVMDDGPDVAAASQFLAVAFARDAMLTNLGVLPFDCRIGALKLEALWGPAATEGFDGSQTIGVATVDGSLSLTHTSHTPPDGLLQAMRSVMVQACFAKLDAASLR